MGKKPQQPPKFSRILFILWTRRQNSDRFVSRLRCGRNAHFTATATTKTNTDSPMIEEKNKFMFHAAPRCATNWFDKAMCRVGIWADPEYLSSSIPYAAQCPIPARDRGKLYTVSIVRNPVDWLKSVYVHFRSNDHQMYTAQMVDLIEVAREKESFGRFANEVIDRFPNHIETIFFEWYAADTYLRVEDFPYCVGEFIQSMYYAPGVLKILKQIEITNASHAVVPIEPALKRRIMKSSERLCDHFEYY